MIAVWTVVNMIIWVVPFDLLCDLERKGLFPWTGIHAFRARAVQFFFRGVRSMIGLRVHATGEDPEAPFLLVSNHLGYLDVFVFMSHLSCALVAKQEIRSWPVVGYLVKIGGTIFIDRNSRKDVLRINDRLEEAMQRGQGIIVFPEGTSTAGDQVLPFRASLLAPIAASDRPVHFASLTYRTPGSDAPAYQTAAWWGDMTFADHFWRMLALPRIDAHVHFGKIAGDTDDRKEVAERLTEEVRACFEPIPGAADAVKHAEPKYLRRL
jgi:1-acyl-sn-glycerol-3-phosphate acyltransferase